MSHQPFLSDGLLPEGGVAELQGLYGSYSFPERLLQKIWLHGDFERAAMRTADGRRIHLRHPGKWNLLGGPDFKGARLRFDDGPEITGDVELHLHAGGWVAHGHAADHAYDAVVLHVVLFPPTSDHTTRAGDGRSIPVLALLPLLHHDIEQFAAEEALETLANRPTSQVHEELAVLPIADLRARLRQYARQRWMQKVRFARVRVQRLGWTGACHHAALEILGYRFNRAPMLRIAAAWPFESWARGAIDLEAVLQSEAAAWSLQGVRPANHPRIRLRQYLAWTTANPGWPSQLAPAFQALPALAMETTTGQVRRMHRFTRLRQQIAAQICAGAIAGTRFDNLVCDGFIPLVATLEGADLGALWFHWYAGDLPPLLARLLRGLGATDGRAHPAAHGLAQGLLGWLIERDVR